jgi:NADPH:quinone reductase-like Zn-dependent oxidoreductase
MLCLASSARTPTLQALRDKGHVQPRHKVLANGASGGAGTFAVPLAKAFSAEVTGVGSTAKVGMVASFGRRPGHRLHGGGPHPGQYKVVTMTDG